ncbi:MAG: helix-turn-helix domain-containing protein [Pyrinomonadaceae bacterium]
MDHNLSLIRALVNTLHIEIETLDNTSTDELGDEPVDLSEKVREYEAKLIRSALVKTGGNQRRAADLLQLKTSTLNAKIKQLGIHILRETQSVNVGLIA